ncbi:MAG: hypothetical protein QM703_27505 [Gemmatales bacterium]
MLHFFMEYPWLAAVALTMLVPIVAIAIAVPMENWRKVREAELDASLKHAMLERGMSAEDIAIVMNARSKPYKKQSCSSTGVAQNCNGRFHAREHQTAL